jgi:integrase
MRAPTHTGYVSSSFAMLPRGPLSRRLCKQAKADGIPFNFVLYDLRHTFATRRATSDKGRYDLSSLAAVLGHSSLRMIQKYVHPTAEHQRALAQKYDEMLQAEEHQIQGREAVRVN